MKPEYEVQIIVRRYEDRGIFNEPEEVRVYDATKKLNQDVPNIYEFLENTKPLADHAITLDVQANCDHEEHEWFENACWCYDCDMDVTGIFIDEKTHHLEDKAELAMDAARESSGN